MGKTMLLKVALFSVVSTSFGFHPGAMDPSSSINVSVSSTLEGQSQENETKKPIFAEKQTRLGFDDYEIREANDSVFAEAAETGTKPVPYFARCAANCSEILKEKGRESWHFWIRSFDGWRFWSDFSNSSKTWKRLAEPVKGFGRSGYLVPSEYSEGKRLVLMMSYKRRGLRDVDADKWVWEMKHELELGYHDADYPMAGPGFVGAWSDQRINLYEMEDGSLLWDEWDPYLEIVRTSGQMVLLFEFNKFGLGWELGADLYHYRLFTLRPRGYGRGVAVLQTRGRLMKPRNADELSKAWLYLDDRGFLVALIGAESDEDSHDVENDNAVQRADQFVVWDLLQPRVSNSSDVAPYELTKRSSEKFSVHCHDLVDGIFRLSIFPKDDIPHDFNDSKLYPNNYYVLSFDKREMNLLEESSANPDPSAFKFENIFP